MTPFRKLASQMSAEELLEEVCYFVNCASVIRTGADGMRIVYAAACATRLLDGDIHVFDKSMLPASKQANLMTGALKPDSGGNRTPTLSHKATPVVSVDTRDPFHPVKTTDSTITSGASTRQISAEECKRLKLNPAQTFARMTEHLSRKV